MKTRAPFCDRKCEGNIGRNGEDQNSSKPDIESPGKNADDQNKFDDGRDNVEERKTQQQINGLGTALDNTAEATGATLQMEAQRQSMKMTEGLKSQGAHSILADGCENRIAQLAEADHQNTSDAESHYEHNRHGNSQRLGRCDRERIDSIAIKKRHIDRDRLGDDKHHNREDETRVKIAPTFRPKIWRESLQRIEAVVFLRRGITGDGMCPAVDASP